MKTLYKTIKIAVGVFLLSALVISCLPEQQSLGGAGQTLVKLFPAGYNMLAFDAKTTAQQGVLFEVRRDAASEADLNATSSVEVKYDADNAILAKYNTKNKTTFIPLPTSLGTVSPAISGGVMALSFAAGEFTKVVSISIPNASSFDFSKKYALAFKLNSVTGAGKLSAAVKDTIVVEVLVKNKWDGLYEVTGTFVDYITSAWVGVYPKPVELRTVGADKVTKYDKDFGTYGYVFDTDGAENYSSFGAFTPAFIIDANNNVSVYNSTTDPLPRGRSAVLYTGEGAINKYNPVDKSIDVAYYLKQLTVEPQLRTLIKEHYEYKGPR